MHPIVDCNVEEGFIAPTFIIFVMSQDNMVTKGVESVRSPVRCVAAVCCMREMPP